MKYITDSRLTDKEISVILERYKEDYEIRETTVGNVLSDMRGYSTSIRSYPSETEEILGSENPNRLCRVYTRYSDGWGCIYENIYCIELL